MWTNTTRAIHARKGLCLPSDLRDEEWTVLEPFLPPASPVGRPRKWPLRRIVEAMLYLLCGSASKRCPSFRWFRQPPGFPGGEIGMLVVKTVVRIRREHAGGKAIRAIARDLRLSRKVVRKAIDVPEGAFGYHRSVQPLPRIGPFQERLDTLLTENEARHRRDRLRMTRIHDLLLREGFEGSYDAVRRPFFTEHWARRWAEARRKDPGADVTWSVAAFIPLLFKPGEAYQFDWSHEDVEIAGKPMRVKVAHMRLCASRAVNVRA